MLNRLKDIILPLGKGNAPTETEVHDVSGTVSFTNENVKRFADQMTKIVVKFFSMNDPSLNDIANPSSEGNFTFNTVPSGEYIIKAEFKFENEVYEGTVTIRVPLTPEQSANITLVQTTQPDVRPA